MNTKIFASLIFLSICYSSLAEEFKVINELKPQPQKEIEIIKQDMLKLPPAYRSDVRYMTAYATATYNEFAQTEEVLTVQLTEDGEAVRAFDEDVQEFVVQVATENINIEEVHNLIASFCLNSLSFNSEITRPVAVIGTAGRIIRFRLSDYGITTEDWEKFALKEPYMLNYEDAELNQSLSSNRPVIRTDWFIANAMYEPDYSALLYSGGKIPKTQEEFLKIHGFNLKDVQDLQRDFGAVSDGFASQVAHNKRKMQRYQGILDYLYRTNDFKDNVDKIENINGEDVFLFRDPSEHLLNGDDWITINGVKYKTKFDEDANELIAQLPNYLQSYCLLNKEDNVVGEADIDIVHDSKNAQYDPVVRTAASCIWCHEDGINIPGNNNLANLGPQKIGEIKSYDPEVIRFLKRFYSSAFGRLVKKDQQTYIDAVARANNLYASENARIFYRLLTNYKFETVNAQEAAVELGITPEELHKLAKISTSKNLIDMFSNVPIPMPRDIWEQQFSSLASLLKKGI